MRYVKSLNLFQDLLTSKAVKRGRLLGLDVGDKYVGLAVSDTHNKIASPLSVLLRKKSNIDLMVSDFRSLISELSLVGFVVGCPFDRQRSAPDNVELLLKPLNLHPVQSKTIIDKFAAVGILQGYLDYVNRKMKLEAAE
ncbi:uncharacterized protein LOC115971305 isoform X5 [Quercus lobata]|uniref:uncharacterized protein LOC115971028 isoform X5 n=1 Tax=Quercus lobata TaxID=97700 RepID=UPI0012477F32|nr:uncharacterized protein LOC115971028 isoform X5 [Quercus lobata]XP_030947009.1 uncharacterized protein LOC115971305 isoform X5 [Quercus lobata]